MSDTAPLSIPKPVAFEVPIERKPLSPAKSGVQQRLESFVRSPSPTKDDIENRLNAANVIRDAKTAAIKTKIATRERAFVQSKESSERAMQEERLRLQAETERKMRLADEVSRGLLTEKINKVKAHNSDVHNAATTTAAEKEAARMSILAESLQRQETAIKAAENNLSSKALAAARHNEEVKERHVQVLAKQDEKGMTLAKEIDAKLSGASANHSAFILEKVMDVGKTIRNKQERGTAAMSAKETSAEALKAELKSRMARVDLNREKALAVRSAAKKTRSPSSSPKKNTTVSAADIAEKLDEASARREVLLQQRSEQCGMHVAHVQDVAKSAKKSNRTQTPTKKLHTEDEALPALEGETLPEMEAASVLEAAVDEATDEAESAAVATGVVAERDIDVSVDEEEHIPRSGVAAPPDGSSCAIA